MNKEHPLNRKILYELLEELQWSGTDGRSVVWEHGMKACCPECGALINTDHAPECKILKALHFLKASEGDTPMNSEEQLQKLSAEYHYAFGEQLRKNQDPAAEAYLAKGLLSAALLESELCCQDICPACRVAAGHCLPSYYFWTSVEPAQRTKHSGWYHHAHYENGGNMLTLCFAHLIRERVYQRIAATKQP